MRVLFRHCLHLFPLPALLLLTACSLTLPFGDEEEQKAGEPEIIIIDAAGPEPVADDAAVEAAPVSAEQALGAEIVAAAAPVSVLWRSDLDQRRPASPDGFSLPVVVKSGQGDRIVAGAQDSRVRIYNMDGRELERIAIDAPGESGGLQLSNGLVVVGDVGGRLYGLDLEQGRIVWRYELPSVLLSSPVAVGDDFIIQTADNHIFRFSADGKKIWSYTGTLGGLGMHLSPAPLLYNNHIYAVFSNGDVVALKAENGGFLWQRQLLLDTSAAVLGELKVPAATPIMIPASQSGRNEDMLVVPIFQGELSFLSLQDGTVLAERKLSLKSSPLLLGDQLFVADAEGAVSALDAAGGDTLWKQKVSDGELTGPILWQNGLWVADDQGAVFRLSRDGRVLASMNLAGRIDRTPVATASGVLVRNSLGTLYMLR